MPEPRISTSERARVLERAKGCCEYCQSQEQYSPDSCFSIEHIIPLSKGGTNTLDNLAFACQVCNNRKYTSIQAFDPVSQSTVPLYHSRQHSRAEHFAWGDNGVILQGLTLIGRAAVEKLQLNRSGLLKLLRILIEVGEHPPVV